MVSPRPPCFDSAWKPALPASTVPPPLLLGPHYLPRALLGRPRPGTQAPATLLGGAVLSLFSVTPCPLGSGQSPATLAPPRLPLVSGDVRLLTLSCHGHPWAASAAAWLNNSSNLVYSSWLLVTLKTPPQPPPRSSCPGLHLPLPIWPPESCSRPGLCALAMNYSGLIWLELGRILGLEESLGHAVRPIWGRGEGARGRQRDLRSHRYLS